MNVSATVRKYVLVFLLGCCITVLVMHWRHHGYRDRFPDGYKDGYESGYLDGEKETIASVTS